MSITLVSGLHLCTGYSPKCFTLGYLKWAMSEGLTTNAVVAAPLFLPTTKLTMTMAGVEEVLADLVYLSLGSHLHHEDSTGIARTGHRTPRRTCSVVLPNSLSRNPL